MTVTLIEALNQIGWLGTDGQPGQERLQRALDALNEAAALAGAVLFKEHDGALVIHARAGVEEGSLATLRAWVAEQELSPAGNTSRWISVELDDAFWLTLWHGRGVGRLMLAARLAGDSGQRTPRALMELVIGQLRLARSRSALARWRQVIDELPQALVVTDATGRVVSANKAFCEFSGLQAKSLLGKRPLLAPPGQSPAAVDSGFWLQLLGGRHWEGELDLVRANGELVPTRQKIIPIHEGERLVGFVSCVSDLSDRHQLRTLEEQIASRDPLTGLANMGELQRRVGEQLLHPEAGRSLLIGLDVVGMARINESIGQGLANELLRQLAERLGRRFADAAVVARWLGDTFALLLPVDESSPETAARAIDGRIDALLADSFRVGSEEVRLGLHRAMVLLPDDSEDPEEALFRLGLALRHARDSRSLLRWQREMVPARDSFDLQQQMQQALEQGQFRLVYQPKVDARNGRIVGAEALIRWQHPERGNVPPMEFIGAAEQSGFIIPLGRWVIETAVAQMACWQEELGYSPVVSVNLSARQLYDPDLLSCLRETLEKYRLAPQQLEVELTESTMAENRDHALRVLNALNELGVSIAIDDFGTGYSSLSYLHQLPVDVVKIDRSFVSGVADDPKDAIIVRSTLTMCRDLGFETVAEGAETPAQGAFLLHHGCHVIQGYLFSPPLEVEDFADRLRQGGFRALARDLHKLQVLVLDEDRAVLSSLRRALRGCGWTVHLAATPADALELMAQHDIGAVVCDSHFNRGRGIDFLNQLRRAWPDTRRILLNSLGGPGLLIEAVNSGTVQRVVPKPWDREQLMQELRGALSDRETERMSGNNREAIAFMRDELWLAESGSEARRRQIRSYNALVDAIFGAQDQERLKKDVAQFCRQLGLGDEDGSLLRCLMRARQHLADGESKALAGE